MASLRSFWFFQFANKTFMILYVGSSVAVVFFILLCIFCAQSSTQAAFGVSQRKKKAQTPKRRRIGRKDVEDPAEKPLLPKDPSVPKIVKGPKVPPPDFWEKWHFKIIMRNNSKCWSPSIEHKDLNNIFTYMLVLSVKMCILYLDLFIFEIYSIFLTILFGRILAHNEKRFSIIHTDFFQLIKVNDSNQTSQ